MRLSRHVSEHHLLPIEQRAMRKKSRGCQDALEVDKMIVSSAKKHKEDLVVSWLDYQKAFDRVPHY